MPETSRQHDRILAAIQAELWAITPDALNQVIAIAQGFGDPEAVAAKLGRPLENTRTVTRRGNVAVVPVTGLIFRYANLFTQISGATSIQQLATDFGAAVADETISGIVLEVDSPGGQAAGVSEFAAMVREATAVKPVVAYVSNYGASAGYWIPAAASEVVISDTAMLGSIGTVIQASVAKDEKSIEIVSSQSPYKRVDASTEEGRAKIQALVDANARVFIESVARYRGVSVEKVLSDFGQGGILVGIDAVNAGLADRLGSLESVISELSARAGKTKPRGTSMSGTTATEKPITRDLIAAEHPAIFEAIKTEGHAEGLKAGADAERERIKAVEAQSLPGHEDLIASLKFDGKTTGPEAAVQVLNAEKTKLNSMATNLKADAPKPVPHAEGPTGAAPVADLPLEDRVKVEWDKDPAIRAEFGTLETYTAFARAQESGKVRTIGKK